MSIFGSIGKALGGIVDTIASPIKAVTGFLGGGVGDVVSGGLDYLGGVQTNNANAAEAQKNRDFQNQQTSTAYQRAVKDLSAAGLNPMLAYTNGGASSGGGAQAVMQNAVGSSVHTAMQAKINNATIQNLQKQGDKLEADTQLSKDLSSKALADINNANAQAHNALSASRNTDVDTALRSLDIPRAALDAKVTKSWLGRNAAYLDRVMKSVSPFASNASSIYSMVK